MTNIQMIELALKITLFLVVGMGIFNLVKYFYDYRIFQATYAKFKGDVYEYDRIRRQQMKNDFESQNNIFDTTVIKDKKIPFLSKLYRRIELTGVTLKIPAFSESLFAFIMMIIGIVISLITAHLTSKTVGAVVFVMYIFIVWYVLGIIVYYRKENVDGQLLQFTNSAASASRQYSSVVDIIGAIYDQFNGPFREALEASYVESKTTNDSDLAFKHMKDKFDSPQLAFVIDNFVMCSASTGDYYAVASDLAKTVAIYTSSHEKKAVTLRNAKINITVMFFLASLIMYSLSGFFGDGLEVLLHTTVGNILVLALVFIFVMGMNIKAD